MKLEEKGNPRYSNSGQELDDEYDGMYQWMTGGSR
jgi:hypothetical protein